MAESEQLAGAVAEADQKIKESYVCYSFLCSFLFFRFSEFISFFVCLHKLYKVNLLSVNILNFNFNYLLLFI